MALLDPFPTLHGFGSQICPLLVVTPPNRLPQRAWGHSVLGLPHTDGQWWAVGRGPPGPGPCSEAEHPRSWEGPPPTAPPSSVPSFSWRPPPNPVAPPGRPESRSNLTPGTGGSPSTSVQSLPQLDPERRPHRAGFWNQPRATQEQKGSSPSRSPGKGWKGTAGPRVTSLTFPLTSSDLPVLSLTRIS